MERRDYTCSLCYWYRLKEEKNICSYNAPAMINGAGTGWCKWEWPVVEPGDYCSQFSPKHKGEPE